MFMMDRADDTLHMSLGNFSVLEIIGRGATSVVHHTAQGKKLLSRKYRYQQSAQHRLRRGKEL